MSIEHFKRIEDKLDKLDSRLDSVDVTLAKQHMTLKEHMRRSVANEENVSMLREDFKPLQKHVAMIEGAFKFLGMTVSAIIGLIGVAAAIYTILDYYLKN